MKPNLKFYKGRVQDQVYYMALPAHVPQHILDMHYNQKRGWAYFNEISREHYAAHVPPVVLERLEDDPHSAEKWI